MRFHTATHLLCAIIPHQTNGCSITADYARLDFDMTDPLDREHLERELARLVAGEHAVSHRLDHRRGARCQADLVRTMSVSPPRGVGRIRLLKIEGVDLQPCGGTHVANTREIGAIRSQDREEERAQPPGGDRVRNQPGVKSSNRKITRLAMETPAHDNPMGTDGFEFVEYTAPIPSSWARSSSRWASPPSRATAPRT
jgi:alanyl-tRNA synthetase